MGRVYLENEPGVVIVPEENASVVVTRGAYSQ